MDVRLILLALNQAGFLGHIHNIFERPRATQLNALEQRAHATWVVSHTLQWSFLQA